MQVTMCPERAIMEHVTSRWGVLVLNALSNGEAWRFSELRRELELASEKMLTQTLRTLERDGRNRRDARRLRAGWRRLRPVQECFVVGADALPHGRDRSAVAMSERHPEHVAEP